MAITYTMKDNNPDDIEQTRTITERKRKLAELPDDLEIERNILDARSNKRAREDAGKDMLLDEIFNKKNRKKGKA